MVYRWNKHLDMIVWCINIQFDDTIILYGYEKNKIINCIKSSMHKRFMIYILRSKHVASRRLSFENDYN